MNQAQLSASTAQRMALIDAGPYTPDQRDDLRSAIGFQHHIMSLSLHMADFAQLQVPSPLSKPTSSLNINFSVTNRPFVQLRVGNCVEGPIHATDLLPFTRVLFVRQGFQVSMVTKENAPAPYNAYDLADLISQITRITGISSCACDQCTDSSNLQGIVVQGQVHNADDPGAVQTLTGVACICRAHSKNQAAIRVADLSRGAQVFFVV
ncbi:hypothetical protein BASA81_000469 [Batrachochytrium salamandrivorans]|nr:hypothetical protein BASA81_000469 [Batrachochytrium salamandrivorans]